MGSSGTVSSASSAAAAFWTEVLTRGSVRISVFEAGIMEAKELLICRDVKNRRLHQTLVIQRCVGADKFACNKQAGCADY